MFEKITLKENFVALMVLASCCITIVIVIAFLIRQAILSWYEKMQTRPTWLYRYLSGGTWYQVKVDTEQFLSVQHNFVAWRRTPPKDFFMEGLLVAKERLLKTKTY